MVIRGNNPNLPKGIHLRVASFNVKNMFDEVDDPQKNDGPPIWKWRQEDIADIISKSDADIIGLQEVENLKVLTETLRKKGLQQKYKYMFVAPSDPRGISVALLSKYPIKKVIVHNEKFKDVLGERDISFKRPPIEAVIEVAPGFQVRTFVVHFKSKRSSGEKVAGGLTDDQYQRYSEANRIRQLVENSDMPTIVMGDMNDTPDSTTIQLVKRNLSRDGGESSQVLYDTAKLVGKENVPTHHSRHGNSKLDYIMVSEDLKDYVEGFEVVNPSKVPESEKASDHYMVIADLRIPLTEEPRDKRG